MHGEGAVRATHFATFGAALVLLALSIPSTACSQAPPATVDDLAWMSGVWRGEGLDGLAEEIWSEPINGSMMASFRQFGADGEVQFYEIITISEVEGQIVMRLKHFDTDLVGWEAQDATVDFPLLEVTDGLARFDGIVYSRPSPDTLVATVVVESGGTSSEETFTFSRVGGR